MPKKKSIIYYVVFLLFYLDPARPLWSSVEQSGLVVEFSCAEIKYAFFFAVSDLKTSMQPF